MRARFQLSAIIWWLAVAVLLFTQLTAGRLVGFVRVVESFSEQVLPQQLWYSPLSRLPVATSLGDWGIWVTSLVTAVLLLLVIGAGRKTTPVIAVVFLVMLSVWAKPEQLLIAVCVFLFFRVIGANRYSVRPWKSGIELALIGALGFAVSIDFGIIVLSWLLFLAGELTLGCRVEGERRGVIAVHFLLLLLVLGAIVFAHQPLLSCICRPLGNAWFDIDPQLFPSQAAVFGDGEWAPLFQLAGLSLLLLLTLSNLRAVGATRSGLLVLTLFLSSCGVLSPDHRWLAIVGLSTIRFSGVDITSSNNTMSHDVPAGKVAAALLLVVACAHVAWTCWGHGAGLLLIGQPRLIELQGVNVSGPVALTNLEHSSDWAGRLGGGRLQLAVGNRWDDQSDVLPAYSQFVCDLTAGRNEHYIRTDGSMGGCAAYMANLKPSLIVLDSADAHSIRTLSVDSDWRVMAIDAHRTIFAKADSSETQAAIRRASELLYFLEWPNPQKRVDLNGVLQTGTRRDARRVAGVLNAMRLPYAALRVLPTDTHRETIAERVCSYAEIAHRVHRQTGHWSLLDQPRAVGGLRKVLKQSWLTISRREHLTRQLESLINLTDSDVIETPEVEIRRNLCRGNRVAAGDLVRQLADSTQRKFLSAFVGIENDSIGVSNRLYQFVGENPGSSMIEEALFYLGCLSIEENQPSEAIERFRRSKLFPGEYSAYSALRGLYLRQLGVF